MLTEGERAIIREDMFEVCKEYIKIHIQTCPNGKTVHDMQSQLAGFKKGVLVGMFFAGIIAGGGVTALVTKIFS